MHAATYYYAEVHFGIYNVFFFVLIKFTDRKKDNNEAETKCRHWSRIRRRFSNNYVCDQHTPCLPSTSQFRNLTYIKTN